MSALRLHFSEHHFGCDNRSRSVLLESLNYFLKLGFLLANFETQHALLQLRLMTLYYQSSGALIHFVARLLKLNQQHKLTFMSH